MGMRKVESRRSVDEEWIVDDEKRRPRENLGPLRWFFSPEGRST